MSKKAALPIAGQSYNCFFDGKIHRGRLQTANVTEVVPFDKADAATVNAWREEVKRAYWLWAKKTDYFIMAKWDDGDPIVYVRTVFGEWYGFDGANNKLDVDGKLMKEMERREREAMK